MRKFQVVSDSSCDPGAGAGGEAGGHLGSPTMSPWMGRTITGGAGYHRPGVLPADGGEPRGVSPDLHAHHRGLSGRLSAHRGAGEGVLCICLNEPFSGSIQCARNAREVLLEEFPQAQVRVLDSRLATVLQGLLVLEAARLRDAGCSLEEAAEFWSGPRQQDVFSLPQMTWSICATGGGSARRGRRHREPAAGKAPDRVRGGRPGDRRHRARAEELSEPGDGAVLPLSGPAGDRSERLLPGHRLRPGPGGVSGLYPPLLAGLEERGYPAGWWGSSTSG